MAGILAWWIGKMLADKKDSITHALEIEFMKGQLKEIKEDVKDLKKAFEDFRTQWEKSQ